MIASGFAGQRQPIDQWGVGEIDYILNGNLRLMTLCLRAAVPLLRHGGPASVVLLTSDMAYIPQPGYAPYVAAKAGMVAMGQAVARELAPNVRINFVSPGAVDTPFLRGGRGRSQTPDAPLRFDMNDYLSKVPLARMATAQDITGRAVPAGPRIKLHDRQRAARQRRRLHGISAAGKRSARLRRGRSFHGHDFAAGDAFAQGADTGIVLAVPERPQGGHVFPFRHDNGRAIVGAPFQRDRAGCAQQVFAAHTLYQRARGGGIAPHEGVAVIDVGRHDQISWHRLFPCYALLPGGQRFGQRALS